MNRSGPNFNFILLGKDLHGSDFVVFESERLILAFRNRWELHYHNATVAGANMAEFAIRSLSTLAFRNPSIQVPGLVPYLGTSLAVYWTYAFILCAGIVAVQILLSFLVYKFDDGPSERDRER